MDIFRLSENEVISIKQSINIVNEQDINIKLKKLLQKRSELYYKKGMLEYDICFENRDRDSRYYLLQKISEIMAEIQVIEEFIVDTSKLCNDQTLLKEVEEHFSGKLPIIDTDTLNFMNKYKIQEKTKQVLVNGTEKVINIPNVIYHGTQNKAVTASNIRSGRDGVIYGSFEESVAKRYTESKSIETEDGFIVTLGVDTDEVIITTDVHGAVPFIYEDSLYELSKKGNKLIISNNTSDIMLIGGYAEFIDEKRKRLQDFIQKENLVIAGYSNDKIYKPTLTAQLNYLKDRQREKNQVKKEDINRL